MAISIQTRCVFSALFAIICLAGCSDERVIYAKDQPLRPVKVKYLHHDSGETSSSYAANLVSTEKADLAFRVSGPVAETLVVAGDRVSKGQVLMRLAPHDFDVQLAEYDARLKDARSTARQANAERKRILEAQSYDAVAQTSVDAVETAVTRSEAGVDVVDQRLQIAKDRRHYSELRAPFDGVVAEVKVEAEEQVISGQKVLTMQGLETFQAEFDVPAELARELSAGQLVQFTAAGFEQSVDAKIVELRHRPNTFSRNFRVTAVLLSDLPNAWPGLDGEVVVNQQQETENGFWLPASVLESDEHQHRVALVTDGTVRKVPVTVLGIQDGLVRLEGKELAEGQAVVLAGSADLADAQVVGELISHEQRASL